MPTFSRLKTWVSNEVLTASDLNAEFNNLLNNMTPTGVDDASASVGDMQATTNPGGVGTESQATDLLGELKRLRYKVKELIGGAQWYSTPISDLGTGGIVTASLANGAVTSEKLASFNYVLSSSSGSFSTTSVSDVDVTNLSVSITTTGRPVVLKLVPDGTSSSSIVTAWTGGGGGIVAQSAIKLLRDGSPVSYCLQAYNSGYTTMNASTHSITVPPGAVEFFDVPAAGTYTYKIQVATASGATNSVAFNKIKLLAYEV